ncbi:rRNA maturation RNase YbeY [Ponticoccus sp. SC2-23]|uniref:rRNA maturation RNase YbeY n=1 Tax=Alexandriicola marinus TaxID=2081710 RepID=UPI000FDC66B2|nr:rRNA maturation RNase YbeY [Alexandriicola marinus]MBM1222224.1 rRNA maturation RNase YbeY [Ponticoccus sp. SC6-9]MBM1226911.1 rRNA maturation RNase YbeY [Ponticoccus sp. SC6-15]MBM1231171.1 rRNA maturation RNase YbeY [Ponticoccus sp. SC6-38]MBM1235577.1 rRNA maturation RNase YbeY [Ponticoccus sp. SC6-45]MBM1240193.1 rRNA maturation RNase YbeY [Ponticoccus sp. SC6-49]MBM1244547.1 rRNA maturation RNase YbeY [Ponticoccus sp. SC2-64]MBM1249051.1 rRNA maturation RNase YbeY [Ponticoccus sp. SC
MNVDCLIEEQLWSAAGIETIAATAADAVAAHLNLRQSGLEISLLACNDARIADLNSDFRGKAVPTNVLSWPSEDRSAEVAGAQPHAPVDPELGDIAIAYQTCLREADAGGRTLTDHATHLVVHGILHLLGYDHERDADATLMEGIETEILGKLGIEDPYAIIV